MSWSPDLYTGEMRPWPESVTVKRGHESRFYVPLDNTLATYDADREILSVVSKYIPNEVRVTKTDQRERDVYTARVYTFVPERLREVLDKLGKENDKLWELTSEALKIAFDTNHGAGTAEELRKLKIRCSELGIEVDE